jgi:DNA-binding transcriptional MocR family regulator
VSRAYALAAERGLVVGEVGRGTFVRKPVQPEGRLNPVNDGTGDVIKLTVNAPPDPSYGAVIAERLAKIAGRPNATADLWAYTPKGGFPEHRAAGARWIEGVGLEASADRAILTGGAHQAIVVAFMAFARLGNEMLVEDLAYAGVCHIAERCGVRLRGLAMDDEGLCPDALDAACQANGSRLLFVNPTVHNPTTATMSLERRRAIAALAHRHDLIVIEDDVYGQLPERRPPAWKTTPTRFGSGSGMGRP